VGRVLRASVACIVATAVLLGASAAAVAAAPSPASHQHRPSPSPASSPSPSPSPSRDTRRSPHDQFKEPKKPGFFDFVGKVRYAISQWFSNLVTSALSPVFDLLGRTVFSTPDLPGNGRIVQLWGLSLGVADAALLILVLVGAGLVTVGGGLASQLTAKELLPRLLLAAITANVSLLLLREMIDLSNGLARGVLGSAEPNQVARQMIRLLGTGALGNPFLALLALVVIVLGILVVVGYVIRVAAMVVLATAAPLLLIGHALPQTEGYARMWWRAMLAFLAAPVAQSLLLVAAFRVLLTGDGVLGLPVGSGLIDILVVGTLLYFLYKVPFWMLNAALSGAGSKAVLQVKRIGREVAKAAAA
jgi:hypothetical protein